MTVHRGRVTAVDTKGVYVRVAALGPDVLGPLEWVGSRPGVDEGVLVLNAGSEAAPDLLVAPTPTRVQWKSGSIAPWNYGDYADLGKIRAAVRDLGLNAVCIPVAVDASSLTDSAPVVDADRLAWALTIAADMPAHVKIIAEPYPWIADGTLSETLWNPSDKPAWFAAWTAACVDVAEAFPQAAMVYVGSNMVSLEGGHDAEWIAVAEAVRAVTGANVSYRCNWWYEASRLQALCDWEFLRHLDVVSVAAYFELTDTASPDADEVRACLDSSMIYDRRQDVVADVARLHEATGKPIFFGELVCSKWLGSLSAPWNPDVGTAPRTVDPMVQRRFYAAYVDAFGRFPWWQGFSVYGLAGFDDSGYVLTGSAIDYLRRIPRG